jgi:protein phosphatase 1 regulatory subunit 7
MYLISPNCKVSSRIRTAGCSPKNLTPLNFTLARTELYLIENKLSELPEPDQFANRLTSLEMLELGGNRFRSLGSLHLPVLTKLWVGKNKLTSLREVNLPHLRLLSMQSNRLVSFRELPALEHLEELYLSHNGLESLADMPPSIVRTLQMFDVGTNRVTSLAALPAFPDLSRVLVQQQQNRHV